MSFNNTLQDNINAISCLKNSFPVICPSVTTTPSTEVQLQSSICFPRTHHVVTKKMQSLNLVHLKLFAY